MSKTLHIVSFDVPFPANYGGVIDVYYKLVWLKKAGVKVILHCFSYGRKPSAELEKLCEKVYYYRRNTGFLSNLSFLPYNVRSRMSAALEKNLLVDDHPVLFEVLHTCYLLNDKRFSGRRKIYRHSNIEHDYYNELARSEKDALKKIYLKIEAGKLKRFEPILKFADLILAVNQKDTLYFRENYPDVKCLFVPSFHRHGDVDIKTGKGNFILFHGNLSVSENYEAATWLVENVFSKLKFKCVIAGLNPPRFLEELVSKYAHIELVVSPDEPAINALIADAQVHVLYTSQPTGLKLKLLNVLFKGRFVICNAHMLSGTGISANPTLSVCNSPSEFMSGVEAIMSENFNENFVAERRTQITNFDNLQNCQKLIASVFDN